MKIKKIVMVLACVLFMVCTMAGFSGTAYAAPKEDNGTISKGISIAGIDVSGMTAKEARAEIDAYLEQLGEKTVTFEIDSNEVSVTADELGLSCNNLDVAEEAVNLGKTGNIIQRYKALKDLEHAPKEYELELIFDEAKIKEVINEKCLVYDVEPKDASIKRENGKFIVTDGQTGVGVDVDESVKAVAGTLKEWNREAASVELIVEVTQPKANKESFEKVKDVLGTFTTSYSSSGTSRSANVANGAVLINGTVILPGETFSTYDEVAPFTADNGYYMAGSYLQGQVVDSIGGGICQVSTTLYNAVLLAELDVTERHNHSMSVSYVDLSADAAIAESAGKDFRFVNNTDYPIYIEGSTHNKNVTFTIYGAETRPANRTIKYVSEKISETQPAGAKYSANPGMLFGQQKQTQSPHTGYTAKLHKYVYIDGKESSVEEVNYSSYKAEPAYISVGTAWGDEGSIAVLNAALATNDPATVNATLAELAGVTNMAAALQAQAEAQAAAEAAQAAALGQ